MIKMMRELISMCQSAKTREESLENGRKDNLMGRERELKAEKP
jgi:hypothetical protein